MKAIILIELPDDNLIKATSKLYDRLKCYNCCLKQIPERKIGKGEYQEGFNACVDEVEYGL